MQNSNGVASTFAPRLGRGHQTTAKGCNMVKSIDLAEVAGATFPRLYRDRIEPLLREREDERLAAVSSLWHRAIIGAVITVPLAMLVYTLSGDFDLTAILGAVAAVVVGGWAYAPVQAVGVSTKKQALSTIAEAIGCSYHFEGFVPEGIDQLRALQLLPKGDRAYFQDCFAGHHHGCSFSFYEGHIERKTRSHKKTRWVTLFRGQLIRVDFPKRFLGTTVVRRDAGVFNFLEAWDSSMQRVGLGDRRIEEAFEVYATDQIEARTLIHPFFMERLLELEHQFQGKALRCAFTKGQLLIAIEGGDRFEFGSMFKTLLDEKRVQQILKDISEILQVIDAVLTAEKGALPT